MPLFALLKSSQHPGGDTNVPDVKKFQDMGYPLLFEPENKHLFFCKADTEEVNKFYCAPLSKSDNITAIGNTIDISKGGSFDVQYGTRVNDHVIRDRIKTVNISKETEITTSATDISNNQNLTWSNTVKIPINVVANGTNNHNLGLALGTITMPANPNTDNHKAKHEFSFVGDASKVDVCLSNTGSSGDGASSYTYFGLVGGPNIDIAVSGSNSKELIISAKGHAIAEHTFTTSLTDKTFTTTLNNINADGRGSINFNLVAGTNVSFSRNSAGALTISSSYTNTHVANHTFSVASSGNTSSVTLSGTNSTGGGSTTFNLIAGTNVSISRSSNDTLQISTRNDNTHVATHAFTTSLGSGTADFILSNVKADGTGNTNFSLIEGSNIAFSRNETNGAITIGAKGHATASHVFTTSLHSTNTIKVSLSNADSTGTLSTEFLIKGGGNTTVSRVDKNTIQISSTHNAPHSLDVGDTINGGGEIHLSGTNCSGNAYFRGTGGTTVTSNSSNRIITINSSHSHNIGLTGTSIYGNGSGMTGTVEFIEGNNIYISPLDTGTNHGQLEISTENLMLGKCNSIGSSVTYPTAKASCFAGIPVITFGNDKIYINGSGATGCSVCTTPEGIRFLDIITENSHVANHEFSVSNNTITLSEANKYCTESTSFNINGGNGITITGSGKTLTITNSKPDVNHNTDTKCTSPANHYTPSGTVHNGNLVRGITYDSKGHITDVVRTTSVNDIQVVSSLPPNASSYPNTLFLVTGGG